MEQNKQKYCLGFIFDKNLERVLLIQKNRGPCNMANKLNGIGGHIEENEEPINAMARECMEETGLLLPSWFHFCILDTKFGYVYCFYTVTDEIENYKQIEDEKLNIYEIEEVKYMTESSETKEYLEFDLNAEINEKWYKDFPHMNNLEYLIPMALNHYKKLDDTKLFEIIEKI